ncbi:MAG: hypothetical protein CML55_02605 [Rhodobacteraceae bacterium]|nr:hypothetical protein [Paracoccaceae bacterium]
MSNIIHGHFPQSVDTSIGNPAALLRSVAQHRCPRDDVYWLKENAELLGMLACTGVSVPGDALSPYVSFYETAPAFIDFFPQYYRFILSICLDLEDLGMGGDHGSALCARVVAGGASFAELSDLQRAEAGRLLARRGVARQDADLRRRLRDFAGAREGFAVPNRKAAYELTHIVFYLSDYGRRDPCLCPETIVNLDDLGLVALLDQDHDLLAEVCLALRFAGAEPDPFWEIEVAGAHRAMLSLPLQEPAGTDDYHVWLTTGWLLRHKGMRAFENARTGGLLAIRALRQPPSILRQMSHRLYKQGEARRANWSAMKDELIPVLKPDSHDLLTKAERSSPRFAEFFARFARIPRAA